MKFQCKLATRSVGQCVPRRVAAGDWAQALLAALVGDVSRGNCVAEKPEHRGLGGKRARRTDSLRAWSEVALALLLVWPLRLEAQSNTRLLLASGSGVPGHAGFVFGPFSSLEMNESRDIIFLSTLRSTRKELPAVVRSSGVTFSVLAFQGLRSPVPKTTYDSFSAPCINDSGAVAFTAALKDTGEAPGFAVIHIEGSSATAVATTADGVPGLPETTFLEFSAPLITSTGNILFAARWGGKKPGTGLVLWTPRGLQVLDLPAGLNIAAKDLLEPIFFSHDEGVFITRGTSSEAAVEQFFRAVATRSFQELKPPPDSAETTEVLAARAGETPVQMLLVMMEGESVQTAVLLGDPSQAVTARRPDGATAPKLLGRIQGQTATPRGNIIFAASAADVVNDVGLYCFCDGQVIRLTSAEEFAPITQAAPGKPLLSLTGDAQQTTAFIAPGAVEGASAIYVTSIP
jgi:hypothetical protein